MGISSLPAPSEGILMILVVNTVLTISLFKEMARFLRDVAGLLRPSAEDNSEPDSLGDRFRLRVRPIRFGSRDPRSGPADCRVCLGRFEVESLVNRLSCGHVFHNACLDRWFDYQRFTCPLCRTQLLPPQD
ncbi:putative E3 ubiquitin-protein ligase XERICO [Wolffia australiana]